MTTRVAYVEEPPFYWTAADGSATGADIELARVVLTRIGETSIEFVPVAFDDLLSGVSEGRWDMNVPIFVTPERERRVTFSVPVWSLSDGFVVRRGNPKSLTSYSSVGSDGTARLGLIPGQVQFDAATAAGVPSDQIVTFAGQAEAVAALLAGRIDAFAATTIGNRVIVADTPELESVPFPESGAVGAFSFALASTKLIRDVNDGLHQYLGSDDHRARMARYGLTREEIDGALRAKLR
jgi:polar amino acid transport system substrate-binding protein